MKISKKYFFIDTFSSAFYFGCKFFFNILIYSLLINTFSIKEYGVYIFFATLMGQLEFIQSGFATSLQRFIPIYTEENRIVNLITLTTIIYFFLGLLFSIIILALSYFKIFDLLGFSDWWNYVQHLIYFAPLIWLFKPFSFALKGAKDFRSENSINIVFLTLELSIVYMMVQLHFKLDKIFFVVLLILLLKHIGHMISYMIRHKFRLSMLDINYVKNEFKSVKNFSFWNFISALNGAVLNQLDKVLVTIFLGPSSLTIYYGINQFLKFYTSVLGVVNSSVIPYFSKKITFSNNENFNRLALKGTSLTTYVGFVLAGVLILNSKFIFSFVSKEYLIEYVNIFNIGIFFHLIVDSRSFINCLYLCEEKFIKGISILGLLSTFLYPIIFWFMIKYFETSGAILSPKLSHLIILPLWLMYNFRKTSLSLGKYFWKIFQNAIPVTLLLGLIFLINLQLVGHITATFIVLEIVFSLVIFALIFLFKFKQQKIFNI